MTPRASGGPVGASERAVGVVLLAGLVGVLASCTIGLRVDVKRAAASQPTPDTARRDPFLQAYRATLEAYCARGDLTPAICDAHRRQLLEVILAAADWPGALDRLRATITATPHEEARRQLDALVRRAARD